MMARAIPLAAPVQPARAPRPRRPNLKLVKARPEPVVPAERALVRFDPLTQYLQEIRRYPLLSREREHELAVRYLEQHDLAAARTLIESNLRLVVKIAYEYRRSHANLLDLIQEGNVGLLQAVRKYDPYRGVKLGSYAVFWIRAYILKFIVDNFRTVKLGTTQAQRRLFFHLKAEKDKLEREGFTPATRLLAERLEVDEDEVIEMEQRLGGGDLSLDAPLGPGDEDGHTRLDRLSGGERPDAAVEGAEFRALLRARLDAFGAELTGRDKAIFEERLLADEPRSLKEIGAHFGISRERARQIEARLKQRLQSYLRHCFGDAVAIGAGALVES
ncbi:MAG TPA: RNA polymerase factor sigma-32 [Polyangia bacterium]|nr:RNA polymerase factor sigma-32 [Polyangia bacterium]